MTDEERNDWDLLARAQTDLIAASDSFDCLRSIAGSLLVIARSCVEPEGGHDA